MPVSDLSECIACCSCGLCSSQNVLCEKCSVNTLKANGIPLEYLHDITGLNYKAVNYGNSFQFSELYDKLNEIFNRNE